MSDNLFKKGDCVVLKSDRSVHGVVTHASYEDMGGKRYRFALVDWADGTHGRYSEDDLDPDN